MFMIDQHAAHERILYEQFMAARQRQEIPSQSVISGSTVHLTPDQGSLLEENLEMLADVGFKIEPFGPNTFVVRAVPAILARQDPARALMIMVEDLESGNEPMQEEVEARIIIRVCKTAAIKAGQTLSREEMQAMIEQLERCHNPHTCPHGRPTLIHLSMMQLAREFGRT
jgi:DNA mismatch repair protein MutL